ncbi:MAG: DUF1924 domain-containing protein [Thiocapsa sp.]|nr:DUF1924 domain-containing protein [Thiocapsa sp.]MCG6896774.1 DUF1924 domain-containing protein [Thiocapsa sp.]
MKSVLPAILFAAGVLASPGVLRATDAAAGAAAWIKAYPQADGSAGRSCVTCHGRDLTAPGRHAVTHKVIEPLAPSMNPQRLTDSAKVEKWLLRNCRWTLGRECSPQEKANFISYIRTQ